MPPPHILTVPPFMQQQGLTKKRGCPGGGLPHAIATEGQQWAWPYKELEYKKGVALGG